MKEVRIPTALQLRDWVAQQARKAGCTVELVPYKDPSWGYRISALKINGVICTIQRLTNAQNKPGRKQVYASTGVRGDALKNYHVTIFGVVTPGFKRMALVVPSHHMRDTCRGRNARRPCSLRIPLKYRPENPVIDFVSFDRRWDLIEPYPV